ncbi:hypothetical protein V2G26_007960 [Clonostachys chloroleuca]
MEVLRYLPDFLNAKFMDRDLPVREDGLISGNQLLDKTPFNIERHASNFPLEGKSRRNRSDFLEKQWYFLSPDCSNRSLEIHDFHSKLPMAYLPPWSDNDSISTSISISNFSVVWRVHLHPDHFGQHQSSSSAESSSEGIQAALKILTVQGGSGDASGDMEKFYHRETRTLQTMTNLNHGQLLSTIFVYRSGQHSMDFVAWSLDQMHGIFEGLSKLHQQNIRHGDIKPHNILHFPQKGPRSASGRLVVADVGISKFHQEYTADRRYTSTTQCTVMYQPPEVKNRRRSRLFDYWSLGCVLLEFTIWIYDSYGGLCNFRKSLKESQPNLPEDKTPRFWDYEGNQIPKLNTAVENTMNEMQRRDSPLSEFANELIELISTKLLNIDAYHGEKIGTWNRDNAEVVRKEVFAIRERYMKSHNCLWSSLLTKHRAGSDQPTDQTIQPTVMVTSSGGGTYVDANLKSGEPVILIRDSKSHVVRLPGQDSSVISLYSEPDFANKKLISSSTWASTAHKKMGSPQQKKLLNAWINLCNKTHNCYLDTANGSAPGRHMPTRLISMGNDNTSTIRLVFSNEVSQINTWL